MGVINPANTLQFRSSSELFARVKQRLASFDSQNMLDEGAFYDDVFYVLNQLGAAVFKECEALVEVKDHRGKLPCNFKLWYAAFKCHRDFGPTAPDINEQNNFGQPWIWYSDAELTQPCKDARNCSVSCCDREGGKLRIVVRTFINGTWNENCFREPIPLILSPNVKDKCAPHCMKVVRSKENEVTIDHDGYLRTHFKEDTIYMQYYGFPMDDDFLPLIPDNESVEKAIEYYIYKMRFEEWYFNQRVPDIVDKLQYANQQYDYHFGQARYWCRLPSFQNLVQAIRVQRGNNKFYQFQFDRTRVGYYGDFAGSVYGGNFTSII
jgi:hypothetical protein